MGNFRNGHPEPMFEREKIIDLNGEWDFGFERIRSGFSFSADEGKAKDILARNDFPAKINVPFCIESKLSGLGLTGYVNHVWYRRTVKIPKKSGRVFLHIGAADHLTTVLVNGECAGRHRGGYTSFAFEITPFLKDGENELFILCEDNVKDPLVARGKQVEKRDSCGCEYTRTTGIWQSVWLEFTPESYLKGIRLFPNPDTTSVTVRAETCGREKLSCKVTYRGKSVGSFEAKKFSGGYFTVELSEKHLWEPGKGRLYDLEFTFGKDKVKSYFGLRSARLDGFDFLINEKKVFQATVLDQGFYPDGLYTAPTEEDLIKDIELSMAVGFNGARLHQKVFEPRFLYHCDRLGYLVWGEYANWGLDYSNPKGVAVFLEEWGEAVARDFNHPSIIGWCPFNETWDYHGRKQFNGLLSSVYDYTKAVDPTRPCIDTSGGFHVKTDVFDIHDYRTDFVQFKKDYDRFENDGVFFDPLSQWHPGRQKYGGEAVFISEYGGIKWVGDESIDSWGYGDDVKTTDEFIERYVGLTEAITGNSKIFGFCYTQLYDIEHEQNGLYTYKREKKFSDEVYEKLKKANQSAKR